MSYIWQNNRWPNFKWNMERISGQLGRTRMTQGKILSRMETLNLTDDKNSQSDILVEETVNTAAIEGEIFNRDSVRSSVARHLGLPAAGLPTPTRDLDGLVEMLINATMNYDTPLTARRIKGWQAALFPTGYSGFHKIRVGKWRGPGKMQVISGPFGREKIHYEAPPHNLIETEIKAFLNWWKKESFKLDGLIRAAVAHFWFVTIHPFDDGNGRIARAITDMAIAQDEKNRRRFYSLSKQIMDERKSYYNILEKTQKGSLDITEWVLWFLECVQRAIKNSERTISDVLAKAIFWQKHAHLNLSKRQKKVLNKILDAGKGNFAGGLTTRKYSSIAKVSRATAYREINDLLQKGLIKKNKGQGRSVSYDINWPVSEYHFDNFE